MLADIRIASDNSQFGIPAAKLGIAYGYDGLKHLVSLVGPSWARLLMYTGMRIDSAEAVRIGLVDRVLPDAELWDATMEIARTISGNAPLAIKAAKITIAQVLKDESHRDMEAIKRSAPPAWTPRIFARAAPRSWKNASRSSREGSATRRTGQICRSQNTPRRPGERPGDPYAPASR